MARKSSYVTTADCAAAMGPMVSDMKTIKEAIVGPDLRGGIVKDVADLKVQVSGIIKGEDIAAQSRNNTRLALLTATISGTIAIVSIIVNVIFHVI